MHFILKLLPLTINLAQQDTTVMIPPHLKKNKEQTDSFVP